jgi:small subunit ribosomal protein S21
LSPLFSRLPGTPTSLNVKIKIEVGSNEPIESALRRFKRAVNKSGHLMELRHRRFFETPQESKKRKVKEARLRIKFERMQRRRMMNNNNNQSPNSNAPKKVQQ